MFTLTRASLIASVKSISSNYVLLIGKISNDT